MEFVYIGLVFLTLNLVLPTLVKVIFNSDSIRIIAFGFVTLARYEYSSIAKVEEKYFWETPEYFKSGFVTRPINVLYKKVIIVTLVNKTFYAILLTPDKNANFINTWQQKAKNHLTNNS